MRSYFFFPLGRGCSLCCFALKRTCWWQGLSALLLSEEDRTTADTKGSSSSRIFKDFKKYQQQTESYNGSTTSLWPPKVIIILSLFLKKWKWTSSKLSKKENLQTVFFSKSWLVSLSSVHVLRFQDQKWNANSLSLTYIKESDNYIQFTFVKSISHYFLMCVFWNNCQYKWSCFSKTVFHKHQWRGFSVNWAVL